MGGQEARVTIYSTASQLLRPGEVGLVLFTEGANLTINPDGSGSTGDWVVDPRRRVDWIIMYRREAGNPADNELLMARSGDFEGPRGDRYLINLRDVKRVGSTNVNWREFAGGWNNPVRYIARE